MILCDVCDSKWIVLKQDPLPGIIQVFTRVTDPLFCWPVMCMCAQVDLLTYMYMYIVWRGMCLCE